MIPLEKIKAAKNPLFAFEGAAREKMFSANVAAIFFLQIMFPLSGLALVAGWIYLRFKGLDKRTYEQYEPYISLALFALYMLANAYVIWEGTETLKLSMYLLVYTGILFAWNHIVTLFFMWREGGPLDLQAIGQALGGPVIGALIWGVFAAYLTSTTMSLMISSVVFVTLQIMCKSLLMERLSTRATFNGAFSRFVISPLTGMLGWAAHFFYVPEVIRHNLGLILKLAFIAAMMLIVNVAMMYVMMPVGMIVRLLKPLNLLVLIPAKVVGQRMLI